MPGRAATHAGAPQQLRSRPCLILLKFARNPLAFSGTKVISSEPSRLSRRCVRFELTEQTRQAVEDYLRASGKKPGEVMFSGRRHVDHCMTTRQYSRLVSEWIGSIGLDPRLFGTHSLRRMKATLTDRRTGNLRAVQLLLGHTKIESTVGYLGIEVDDALAIAEQADV